MKKNVYLMTAMVLLVFVWCAGSLAADKADKIGFINLRQIMQDSNAGKKATEEFKIFYEKKTQEIKSAENELKTLKNELDKQSEIMTQSARSERESAYQKKLRDYQLLVNDTNEELKRRDQEMTQKIMPEIIKIVRSVAARGKYTLVIDVASMPMPYYDKKSDFTDKVIEEYNKSAI
ncbi:MAG: OmpH family outer membrane protein [Smithella sp.]